MTFLIASLSILLFVVATQRSNIWKSIAILFILGRLNKTAKSGDKVITTMSYGIMLFSLFYVGFIGYSAVYSITHHLTTGYFLFGVGGTLLLLYGGILDDMLSFVFGILKSLDPSIPLTKEERTSLLFFPPALCFHLFIFSFA